ncbi:MAG: hypothetical protein KAI43_11010 [Candidatus Aureabacteria bacterium]|nr:hypothetical protein [Candidatus Auribacterota bacterium]
MKNFIFIYILSFIFFSLSMTSCTTYRGVLRALPPSMTKQNIIELSQSNVSEEIIIGKINSTYSVFYLSVNDIIELSKKGVSNKIIEYMRETEILARERAFAASEIRHLENQQRTYWRSNWYYHHSMCR